MTLKVTFLVYECDFANTVCSHMGTTIFHRITFVVELTFCLERVKFY